MEQDEITPFKIKMVKAQETIKDVYTQEELCALIQPLKREDSFVVWRSWAIINFILGTAAREATVCEMQIVLLLGGEQNGSNMRRCRSSFLLPDGYFFRCR